MVTAATTVRWDKILSKNHNLRKPTRLIAMLIGLFLFPCGPAIEIYNDIDLSFCCQLSTTFVTDISIQRMNVRQSNYALFTCDPFFVWNVFVFRQTSIPNGKSLCHNSEMTMIIKRNRRLCQFLFEKTTSAVQKRDGIVLTVYAYLSVGYFPLREIPASFNF